MKFLFAVSLCVGLVSVAYAQNWPFRGDVKLDPRLFDPQFWTTVHWKK